MAYYHMKFEDEFDLAQELACCSFSDMLLDRDRNFRFKQAIREAIKEKHVKREMAIVIDIGTGCGLLSLYAAEAGADVIKALEVFGPVAHIARDIFNDSQYADRIELITKRSTDLNGPIYEKGNILVAEVFDTELIGEGALRTFKEAFQTLILPNSRVIPAKARIWVLPIQGDELMKFTQQPSKQLKPPKPNCPGHASVFDLQTTELEPNIDFIPACKPFIAFEFNFESPESIHYHEATTLEFLVENSALCKINAVIVWWELDMLGSGTNIITTAPKWADSNNYYWRDHWMQAVYFLNEPVEIRNSCCVEQSQMKIHCSHDEFSLYFGIDFASAFEKKLSPPICHCRMHTILSRTNFYRINTIDEGTELIWNIFDACKDFPGDVVSLGEGSFVGLYIARLLSETSNNDRKNVHIVETNKTFATILTEYSETNQIASICQISSSISDLDQKQKYSAVIFEPFYLSYSGAIESLVKTLYDVKTLCKHLNESKLHSLPQRLTLWALPVKFENLWKLNATIDTIDGHDLSIFGTENRKAKELVERTTEEHSLWEYHSVSTGHVTEILSVDLSNEGDIFGLRRRSSDDLLGIEATVTAHSPGTNGLCFWLEALFPCLDGSSPMVLTNGLQGPCNQLGDRPRWHRGYRQTVHFIPLTRSNGIKGITVKSLIDFTSVSADIPTFDLNFDYF